MMQDLMRGLVVHHIRFKVQALNPIHFGDQPGSAVRGALYEALSSHFCTQPRELQMIKHDEFCPVCWLLNTEDEDALRGRDLPRALAVQPPLKSFYKGGEIFVFGFTLIGRARSLTVHLLRSVMIMGDIGIGQGRGKFKLLSVSEYNPLLDAERLLLDGTTLKQPTLVVNNLQIQEATKRLWTDRVTLRLVTPLRLIAKKQLLRSPEPTAFIQRLVERCQSLVDYYSEDIADLPPRDAWKDCFLTLTAVAEKLKIAFDETEWVEAWSGSRRQGKYTPISGLVGVMRWEGELSPLLPWLLWGQSLHVGKNAVKGNGWYQIVF